MPEPARRSGLDELVRRRDEAAVRVASAPDPDAAQRIYDSEYFSLALAVMDERAEPADVLVTGVGEQPYSVALSLRLSPAAVTYLIHTNETHQHAIRACELAGVPLERVRMRSVDKASSVQVYQRVREAAERHREQKVVVNITSGTKAMTAAASSVAGYLKLRQVYIESVRLGKTTLFGREVDRVVEHPVVVLGDPTRLEAERAFDDGRFDLAERLFQDLQDAHAPDYLYHARIELCRAYADWGGLRFASAAEHLRGTAEMIRKASASLAPREPIVECQTLFRDQAQAADRLAEATGPAARPHFDAGASHALCRFFLRAALRRVQREPDLAALLVYRCLELTFQRRLAAHGLDAMQIDPERPGLSIDAYNAVCDARHRLERFPERLALAQTYTALLALEDPAVLSTSCPPRKVLGMTESRNQGIFTHGFRTTDPARSVEFLKLVLEFASAAASADELNLPALEEPDPLYDFHRFASGPEPPGSRG